MKWILVSIFIGLPLIVCCSTIVFSASGYYYFKSQEPGWEVLPIPSERVVDILSVINSKHDPYEPYRDGDDFTILVRTDSGGYYTCKPTYPACLPAKLNQEQVDYLVGRSTCVTIPGAENDHPDKPIAVDDRCTFYGPYSAEVFTTVALLKDNSLWWSNYHTNIDPASLFVLTVGLPFGVVIGLIIGLALVIVMIIKHRRAMRQKTPENV